MKMVKITTIAAFFRGIKHFFLFFLLLYSSYIWNKHIIEKLQPKLIYSIIFKKMMTENGEMMLLPSFQQLEVTRDHKNNDYVVLYLVKDANCLIVASNGLLLLIIIVIVRLTFIGIQRLEYSFSRIGLYTRKFVIFPT